MIQEAYCSFELSKLFKEKGFVQETLMVYNQNGNFMPNGAIEDTYQIFYPAPTQQMAMAWLREVHGIFIGISLCERYENKTDNDTTIMFFFELLNLKEKQLINGFSQEYTHTYEEACEAAIKYCLENLI